ncbi:hypothetical protein VTN96DRAFT_9570 [Rasamsonia emersonii]
MRNAGLEIRRMWQDTAFAAAPTLPQDELAAVKLPRGMQVFHVSTSGVLPGQAGPQPGYGAGGAKRSFPQRSPPRPPVPTASSGGYGPTQI